MAVDGLDVKIHVVDPHHFAVVHVNDLLVENIMLDPDQALIGGITANFITRHIGLSGAHGDGLDLRVGNALQALLGRADQIRSHPRGLVARINAQVLQLPQEFTFHAVHGKILQLGEVDHRHPPPPRTGLAWAEPRGPCLHAVNPTGSGNLASRGQFL